LREGQLTVSELCSSCLAIADKYNAFVYNTDQNIITEQIKASEERLRKGQPLGPLDGIPFAVKDNFSTKGIKTTCASRTLFEYVPPLNATVVQRLLDQGGILIGKTNLDEFAMGTANAISEFGPALNPWPLEDSTDKSQRYLAGGSSGGSAAAVAAGMSLVALGSDTGGSVRLPAAWCGLAGLKPTYGRLSRYGLIPLASSFDAPGIVARSVQDIKLVYEIVAGHDPKDATSSRRPIKCQDHQLEESANVADKPLSMFTIGIAKEHHIAELDKEILESWSETTEMLESLGARIVQISLPHSYLVMPCYIVLTSVEVSSNMARYDGLQYGYRSANGETTDEVYGQSREEGFGPAVRRRILAGTYFSLRSNRGRYLEQAQKVRRLILNDYKNAFGNGIDMILSPSVLTVADAVRPYEEQNIVESLHHDFYLAGANLAGIPSLVIPTKTAKKGLPISMSLVAPSFRENRLFDVGCILENELGFISS
ncbi:uncharacterized protein TRIADDRAFT_25932, partial [Trichoplax adhaerens]